MLQTAQRVGSAIGVAIVLAQFFDSVAASRGQDYAAALTTSLRTTVGFVVLALIFALADLLRRRSRQGEAAPRRALQGASPGGAGRS
jgi:uncharacterized membrane protein